MRNIALVHFILVLLIPSFPGWVNAFCLRKGVWGQEYYEVETTVIDKGYFAKGEQESSEVVP